MKSISSHLSIFYIVVLLTTTFLFTSCEPNDERVGGFPQEGQIWAEIENLDYTFSDATAPTPSFLNTYTQRALSLSIYRTTSFNALRSGSFQVILTKFNFDDTTPRKLDNTQVNLKFFPSNNVIYNNNEDKTDTYFEILSIENDIIKANFSGTLQLSGTSQNDPNFTPYVRVRNGALNIKVRRE